MSRFDPLKQSIVEAVAQSEALGDLFAGRDADWLDWNLPPNKEDEVTSEGYPCIRVTLLDSRNTRQGHFIMNVNLWDNTDNSSLSTDEFLHLADELEAGLNACSNIISAGYRFMPEPHKGLNHALFPITYIAGLRG